MIVALASDMQHPLLEAIERRLRELGHDVRLLGALAPQEGDDWPSVGRSVGEAVARGDCAQGIVCCWTGTGVSIAANKVPGVRAALCGDAQTAEGARVWNDANVLALSLRATSIPVVEEILDAWFRGEPTQDETYRAMIDSLIKADNVNAETGSV
jgi:RpiB/LacA/LacB family sugar-phosphate isomerase